MPQNDEGSRTRVEGFRLGEWRVDPAAGELSDDARVVRLRPKVMELLVSLAARPGEVLAKQELLDAVWPDVVVAETSLSVTVAQLRKALGDDPARPTFVETIPRRGYRLVATVDGAPRSSPRLPASSPLALIGREVTLPLKSGRTVIGRDPACDARLDSYHISRFHVAVEVHGGRVVVEDLGSKNGTFINGKRISTAQELRPGDRLRLGRHAATLQLAADGASTWTEMSAVGPIEETRG